jgi:hypothetical protein
LLTVPDLLADLAAVKVGRVLIQGESEDSALKALSLM